MGVDEIGLLESLIPESGEIKLHSSGGSNLILLIGGLLIGSLLIASFVGGNLDKLSGSLEVSMNKFES